MILVVLGRSIKECFDRDVRLARDLLNNKAEVEVAVPTKRYMQDGYSDDELTELRSSSGLQLHTIDTTEQLSDLCKVKNVTLAVFSQNNAHKVAIRRLRKKLGVLCVSYSSYASLDHFNLGENVTIFRSDMMRELNKLNLSRRELARSELRVAGCLSQLGRKEVNLQSAKSELGVEREEKVVGFHPKNIEVLQKRIPVWFKFKSGRWYNEYLNRVDELYSETCTCLRKHGYKVLETVHPSATEARSRYGNTVVSSERKPLLMNAAEFGVGVTSTISMEYGYIQKPFLFCGSEHIERPNIAKWDYTSAFEALENFGWHNLRPINPWQPFWVGEYVSSIDQFKNVESSLLSNDYDYTVHNEVFWGGANAEKALNDMVNIILELSRKES